jgi:hypothetical protein
VARKSTAVLETVQEKCLGPRILVGREDVSSCPFNRIGGGKGSFDGWKQT